MTKVAIAAIKDAVCREFHLMPVSMTAVGRNKWVVRPRQIAMYLCRELDHRHYAAIGAAFGKRDHTTAMHAHRTIAALMVTDPGWRERVARVRSNIVAPP